MLECVYTSTTRQSLDPAGFLRIEFLHTAGSFDLEEAKRNIEAARILTREKRMPVLLDLRKGFHTPTPEARQYIAQEQPYTKHRLAEAFLLNSLGNFILVSFYIKFNKPPNPAKIFRSETSAIDWLRGFI